ncbi:anion transporter [Rhodoferax sp.]|uniref:anion transporter n=1 Tax=Rhodoferax sp. TaxID=50421 RepID=UPI00262A8CF1|nr:anion transporter [Rhodoferax sp.]MDD2918673.1 anion transporter [Rhodoferax sp.]
MTPEHGLIDWGIVAIFVTVYAGMILGDLPRLKLDRSGVALLGAISVIGLGAMSTAQAASAVDLPTVLLLFSFMVVSAQMRLGGFYTAVTRQVAALPLGRNALLGALIFVAGALSAVFSNDIICLAMTPVVAQLCRQRRLNPVPFLLGLACAANIGSAATLIGNPQNMLIGSVLHLPFDGYVRQALPPVVLSLGVLWAWLAWGPGARASANRTLPNEPDRSAKNAAGDVVPVELASGYGPLQAPPFDAWQSAKGLTVATALLLVFLFTDWPREVAALVGAAVLLLSRRLHSSHVMGFVDWQLLVLFMGLFVVNHAFESTGLAAQVVAWLATQGVQLADPGALFVAGVGLSNLVSNVPAVMLLLPHLSDQDAGVTLALVSTLAGNLLLVGSIANLIVADLAQKCGVALDWRMHARVGVPVTLLTLGVVWAWLRWL